MKIGFAKDIHKLYKNKNRILTLGGVKINNSKWKIKAHSDGDIIFHSLTSALLNILELNTLGELYPENEVNKNIDSYIILDSILRKLKKTKEKIISINVYIVCEKIMLKDYLGSIKNNLKKIFGKHVHINVSVTRFENKKSKYIECYSTILTR